MKSILFLLARYPGYGGIETVTTLLANQFIDKYRVSVCSIDQQDEEHLLPALDSRVAFYKMPYNGLKQSKKNVSFLYAIIEKESVDTIIFQDSYFPCHYLLTSIADCKSLKIIEVEHSSPSGFDIQYAEYLKSVSCFDVYHRFKAWFYHQKSLSNEKNNRQLIYNVCDKYVMLAEGLIPQCQKYGHIKDNRKFKVIGNPISMDNSDADIFEKQKECLFVGRLDSMKGIDKMMRIWGDVEKSISDWTLVIVGDGIMMPFVQDAIKRHRLRNIRVEGFQTDVKKYYRTASIFCMCSIYEGFPMVLPEAMGFGVVPVVFDSFAALDDILIDGEDGLKIFPFDEKAYYDGLLSLMNDKTKLLKMQEKALAHSEKFSLSSIIGKWNNLFIELENNDR